MPKRKFIPIPALSRDRIEIFWSRISIGDPKSCWLWKGLLNPYGYALFSVGRIHYRASRIMFYLAHNDDPRDLFVLHTCDNPQCVNPAHLFSGTHDDNMNDAVNKKRMAHGDKHGLRRHPERAVRGESHGRRKLRLDQVLEIRNRSTETQSALASEFGVSGSTIGLILRREKWKHV